MADVQQCVDAGEQARALVAKGECTTGQAFYETALASLDRQAKAAATAMSCMHCASYSCMRRYCKGQSDAYTLGLGRSLQKQLMKELQALKEYSADLAEIAGESLQGAQAKVTSWPTHPSSSFLYPTAPLLLHPWLLGPCSPKSPQSVLNCGTDASGLIFPRLLNQLLYPSAAAVHFG
jgi:hypothetical protein